MAYDIQGKERRRHTSSCLEAIGLSGERLLILWLLSKGEVDLSCLPLECLPSSVPALFLSTFSSLPERLLLSPISLSLSPSLFLSLSLSLPNSPSLLFLCSLPLPSCLSSSLSLLLPGSFSPWALLSLFVRGEGDLELGAIIGDRSCSLSFAFGKSKNWDQVQNKKTKECKFSGTLNPSYQTQRN